MYTGSTLNGDNVFDLESIQRIPGCLTRLSGRAVSVANGRASARIIDGLNRHFILIRL